MVDDKSSEGYSVGRLAPLIIGPAITLLFVLVPPMAGLSKEAWFLIGLTAWMVIWWLSEAVPIPATALLPIPVMPLLGIGKIKAVTASYAHPLIFLFLGGFLLAAAMQKWGLHRRIALTIINAVGTSPNRIIAGFMLASSFLSMWISNTATTLMMFAVGLSVIQVVRTQTGDHNESHRFGIALMLGIAYSASIGGVGTLIGTPPNALLASVMQETYGIEIDFLNWMFIGVPVVIIMVPIAWVLLTQFVFPTGQLDLAGAEETLRRQKRDLGPMQHGEAAVLIVFVFAALSWIFGKAVAKMFGLTLSDTMVAIAAALILFAWPVSLSKGEFVLDWKATADVPWGILLIFGGGLALATGFTSTGLAAAIGNGLGGLSAVNIWLLVLVVIFVIICLTEVTSNTATTATFLPILGAIAVGIGQAPLLLTIPVAIAASMAFMMPVATPPNAIVFSYDDMKIGDMVRAGFWLNLAAGFVCFGAVYLLAGAVFGI